MQHNTRHDEHPTGGELIAFILIMLVLIAGLAFLWSLVAGPTVAGAIDRVERAECLQWQQQSQQHRLWYATDWQTDQCDQHGINVR